jgi:hypothetical protein
MGKITFQRKANMTLYSIIPQKAIVTKSKGQLKDESQQLTPEWKDFLNNALFKRKPVTVTIEWEDKS